MANTIGGNEDSPNDDGVVVPALPADEFGRPVLAPSQAYQEALQQGYFGNDGKDLGAAVRPEDVHSFAEASGRIDAPAHSETPVVENPNPKQGGYTAFSAQPPAPVVGDATQADNPSINASTEPVEASSTGTVETSGDTTTEQENV